MVCAWGDGKMERDSCVSLNSQPNLLETSVPMRVPISERVAWHVVRKKGGEGLEGEGRR